MAKKIISITLAILIIVSIIEITYLTVSGKDFTLNKLLAICPKQTIMETACKNPAANQIADKNSRSLLLTDTTGVLLSSILTNKFSGEISSLIIKDLLIDGKTYKTQLKIKGKNNKEFSFLFNARDIKLTSVNMENGKTKNINLAQLKMGDRIILESTIDLAKDINNNTIVIKITKI